MTSPLAGKVAIVTGGTGEIGFAIARALDAAGAHVLIHSRSSPEAGVALAAELGSGAYVQTDLAEPGAGERIVQAAIDAWGRLDILVNCAGTTTYIEHDDLEAATPEVWERILGVNLLGPWSVISAAVPHLRASDASSSIVNISSAAGIRPVGSSIPYAVSKAALNHMTVLLARVLGPQIRVNAVAPGVIETTWNAGFAEHRANAVERIPMRGLGSVDDVADAVLYLAGAEYVTGEILVVDGGLQIST